MEQKDIRIKIVNMKTIISFTEKEEAVNVNLNKTVHCFESTVNLLTLFRDPCLAALWHLHEAEPRRQSQQRDSDITSSRHVRQMIQRSLYTPAILLCKSGKKKRKPYDVFLLCPGNKTRTANKIQAAVYRVTLKTPEVPRGCNVNTKWIRSLLANMPPCLCLSGPVNTLLHRPSLAHIYGIH